MAVHDRVTSPSPTQSTPPRVEARNVIPLLVITLILTGLVSDTSVVLSPMVGVVTEDLHLSSSQVSWVLNALALGGAVGVGITARLGDIVGPRRVLLALSAIGLAGAVLSLLAGSFLPLFLGRLMIGLAVSTPLAWAMLRPRATESQLRTASVLLGTFIALFIPLCLILGGILVNAGASWKSVFWLAAAAFLASLVTAAVSPEAPKSTRPAVRPDWLGSLGLCVWLAALLLAISQGRSWGWGSTGIIVLFVVAVVVFVGWVMQQRAARDPLMAFAGTDLRQMISGYGGTSLLNLAASALFVALPIMLQMPKETGYGLGRDQLWSTMPFLMIVPAAVISAIACRVALVRFGPRPLLAAGGTIGAIAFVGLGTLHDEIWEFYLWVFLYGIGLLTCASVGYALVAASGRQDNMSITFGVQYVSSQIAASVVTAVVIAALNPGLGLITESKFTSVFLGVAVLMAVMTTVCAILAPRRIVDLHATDVAELASASAVEPAIPAMRG